MNNFSTKFTENGAVGTQNIFKCENNFLFGKKRRKYFKTFRGKVIL